MSYASHVPPPDPESFWPFIAGQRRVISPRMPISAFTVKAIYEAHIEGVQQLGDTHINGILHLDQPCIIEKDARTGEPLVTLTLRKIEDNRAYIQVTVNPNLQQVPRASIQ